MQRRAAQWMLVMGLMAGCGGDDDGSSGVTTGLPSQQKLSTLSDDEVKKACHSMNDGALTVISPDTLKRASCVTFGIQAGLTVSGTEAKVDVTKCQQAVDTCVKDASEPVQDEDDCETASSNDVAGCEATVGEYEGCFNAFLQQLQARLSQLSCQNAEKLSSSGYENDVDAESTPQCQTFMTKCPNADLGLPQTD